MSRHVLIVLTCCTFIGEIIEDSPLTYTVACDDGSEEVCWKHLIIKMEIV